MLPDSTLCACGCGRPIPPRNDSKQYRYIRGHGTTKLVETACETCGKSIRSKVRCAHVYCSIKCKGIANRRKITIRCPNCGKERLRKPHVDALAKSEFCYHCRGVLRSLNRVGPNVPVTCEACGKHYLVWPSKAKTNKHHYCSIDCRAKHIIGPNNPSFTSGHGRKVEYGFNWKRQRNAALKRDRFQCQHCGKRPKKPRYLHVHHIMPAHRFNGDYESANDLANLITLCMPCHKAAERGAIPIQPRLI